MVPMDPRTPVEDLQHLVDHVLDAAREVLFRTHQHKWQLLSPSWTALSGYDVDESLGSLVSDRVHPDDRPKFEATVTALYRGELVTQTRVRLVTKTGDVRWIEFRGSLVRDARGRVTGVAGVVRDQTLRHVQETLQNVKHDLDRFVLEGEDTTALAKRVCEALSSSMPYPLVWIALDHRSSVDARAGDLLGSVEDDELLAFGGPRTTAAAPGDVAATVRRIAVDDPKTAKLARAGITHVITVPLQMHGGDAGLLGIAVRSDSVEPDHVLALVSFGGTLSLALRLAAHQTLLALQSAAMTSSLSAMLILDAEGRIEWVNAAFERMSEYSAEEVLGQPADVLRSAPGRTPEELHEIIKTLVQGQPWSGELVRAKKSGEHYVVYERVTPLLDEHGRPHHYVVAQEDVTVRRRAEALVDHMARTDPLTELANRSCFEQHLQINLGRPEGGDRCVGLLFVDVDRFKLINDTLGHAVGDELLIEVAGRIRSCTGEGDLVARFGGDEFTVVLRSCDEAEAARVAAEILARIAEPMRLAHHETSITASIGIALGTPEISDAETLVKQADAAMYQAKAIGRNAYAFFTTDLAATSSRALAIQEGLRRALARDDELVLHYQPQMNTRGDLIGVEALLRWTSKELGTVSPAEFIPVAEQSGLIAAIDRWAMRTACAQAKSWHDEGLRVPRVSVNVSGVSFRQGSLAATVENALTTTGLSPELLEIELTEGIMMHDAANVIATLDAVRALGVRVALDDFGTGYSSLGYLKRFKLDELKIDRSFVTGLPHDADSAAIARLIVAMATALRMETVAEGVETAEQAAFLASIGCHTFQGYLFSPAVPPHELARFVRRRTVPPLATEAGTGRAARAA